MATFYDHFRQCSARWPQNIAVEIQNRGGVESYSYADLRKMSESVGRWLAEKGLRPASRVAILAENHPRWVAAYLGTIAAGCTAVPLDTAFRPDQVAKLLKDSGSSLLFCDTKHLMVAEEAAKHTPVQIISLAGKAPQSSFVSASLDDIFANGAEDFTPVTVPSDSAAMLLYTSGTTADPKGVMLTHANLMGEVEAVFGRLKLSPSDAVLAVLPLFHALAQMANLLLPLVKGARVVYLETVNTAELLRALAEREITAFAVVPQFFYLIHERIFKEAGKRGLLTQSVFRAMMGMTRFSRRLGWNTGKLFFRPIHRMFGDHMRYLITGGSRFDPQIGRDLYALGIDVLQAYGLTETTGGAFLTMPRDNVIGSVGPPLCGVEAKIIDAQPPEDGGPAVGEVAIRGPIVMKGYWNRPDATAAVLRDGWLHTGDIGYLDDGGNLFLTGRQKEVIVLSNGKNIYPEEIEAHYLKSAYIKEICVLGLEGLPADGSSDRLHAVVVPNFDVLREHRVVNAKEVIRFDIEGLSAQLPSTKRILSYEIWQQDLPRTTTRKLKRFEIQKRLRTGSADHAGNEVASDRPLTAGDIAWLGEPSVQEALSIIRESARRAPDQIRPGDNLELDLGLDSMQRVELVLALESHLGGRLDEARVSEIYSVRELVDAVRECAGNATAIRPPFAGWKTILAQESTDADVMQVVRPRPAHDHILYFISRLVQMFARERFDLQVQGIERLPENGPYLICSNHQSYLDAPTLISIVPWHTFRLLFAVGTSEIFGTGIMRWLARVLRIVVVDPDANLVPAMRAGAYALRRGRILLLYPEGERSIDGTPRKFKKGAAILSIHLQLPIVPVAIEGFHEVWPRGKSFQGFLRLRVVIGDPILPPPEADLTEEAYEQLTTEVRTRIVAMWERLRDEASTSNEPAAVAAD